jgi:hypothetical protein
MNEWNQMSTGVKTLDFARGASRFKTSELSAVTGTRRYPRSVLIPTATATRRYRARF